MKFNGKDFGSRAEVLQYVTANKSTLISAKKAEIKTKSIIGGFYSPKDGAIKDIPNKDDDFIYPVISNTGYLDHHDDVHLRGSMTKTAKEQNHKVYYVTDHKLEVDSVIATPKNVEIQLLTLPWTDLGRNFEGDTEAFIFKIAKEAIQHEKFLKMLEDGNDLQNSIRMQYIKIGLGINNQDDKEGFAYWQKYYNQISNKEELNERGYFFGVEELKIVMEGSAVLFGSNDATPIKGAVEDTPKFEPSKYDTQISDQLNQLLTKTKL